MSHRHDELHVPEYDRGLQYDLSTLINRRQALRALGATGPLAIISCGSRSAVTTTLLGSTSTTASAATAGPSTTAAVVAASECEVIPPETAGPFPGDGSNGPNVFAVEGVVRSDLTPSFGGLAGTATGVPLTIQMTIQKLEQDCDPYASVAVYVWHCDAAGNYSLYSPAAAEQNYLRGVQEADSGGTVTFQSIFPGCYPGRWPHIHFEVYPSLAVATDAAQNIATSQIALPAEVCAEVYATSGYEGSLEVFPEVSLSRDGVFGEDGGERQLGTMSGDVGSGLVVALAVPV